MLKGSGGYGLVDMGNVHYFPKCSVDLRFGLLFCRITKHLQ
jgi:hypothetical protein